jgi:hypothetical protein
MEGVLIVPIACVGVAMSVLVFVLLGRLMRQAREARGPWASRAAAGLARAAASLGAAGSGDLTKDGAFTLSVDGRPVHLFGARPNKGRNVVVGLGADAAGPPFGGTGRRALERLPRVALRKETGFERFGKRIGLNLEVETGDAEFDGRAYVDSEAPRDDVAAVLADARVRRGALALLDAGCSEVVFAESSHAVVAFWPAYAMTAISPEALQAASRHLLEAADGLPPSPQVDAEAPGARVRWLEIVYVLLGCLGLGFGSATLALWPPLEPRMTAAAAGLAGLATAVLVGLAARSLKGRSDALPRLCVALVGAVMLGPGLAVGALNVANGCLDATSVEHAADVEASYRTSGGRGGLKHYVKVASWMPGEPPRTLEVTRRQFDSIQATKRVLVRVGGGRLGYEWLRSVEPL